MNVHTIFGEIHWVYSSLSTMPMPVLCSIIRPSILSPHWLHRWSWCDHRLLTCNVVGISNLMALRYNQNELKLGTNSLMLVPAAKNVQRVLSPRRRRRCYCHFSKLDYRVMIRLWTLIFSIPHQDLGTSVLANFLRHRIDICACIQSFSPIGTDIPVENILIKIKYKALSRRS
jgi:hypothetical protein